MIEAQLARQNQEPQPFDDPLPLRPAAPAFLLPQQDQSLSLPPKAVAEPLPLRALSMPPVSGHVALSSAALPSTQAAVLPAPTFPPATAATAQRAFVDRLLPAASAAEQKTGIPAHFLVAHAALETGWGKSEPRHADGSLSFNLFGIKAGASWHGPSVEAATTEVIAGVAQRRTERFRAYGSYAEAVNDYVQLLTSNPRYAAVLGAREPARFAQGLQSAGFATDPLYAAKLERIISGNTLRQALTG
jgi:flagellar protein FlgJ